MYETPGSDPGFSSGPFTGARMRTVPGLAGPPAPDRDGSNHVRWVQRSLNRVLRLCRPRLSSAEKRWMTSWAASAMRASNCVLSRWWRLSCPVSAPGSTAFRLRQRLPRRGFSRGPPTPPTPEHSPEWQRGARTFKPLPYQTQASRFWRESNPECRSIDEALTRDDFRLAPDHPCGPFRLHRHHQQQQDQGRVDADQVFQAHQETRLSR